MPADVALTGALPQRPPLSRVVIAATIGHVLEWFDFLVYGYFAVTIAEVFFPTGNPTVSLLITFGAFGLAYVVRPLGAVIVGTYTDRHDANDREPRRRGAGDVQPQLLTEWILARPLRARHRLVDDGHGHSWCAV